MSLASLAAQSFRGLATACAFCVMLHSTGSLPFQRPEAPTPMQNVSIVTTPVPGMTPSISIPPNRRSFIF